MKHLPPGYQSVNISSLPIPIKSYASVSYYMPNNRYQMQKKKIKDEDTILTFLLKMLKTIRKMHILAKNFTAIYMLEHIINFPQERLQVS